jgi:hypothetical protein
MKISTLMGNGRDVIVFFIEELIGTAASALRRAIAQVKQRLWVTKN